MVFTKGLKKWLEQMLHIIETVRTNPGTVWFGKTLVKVREKNVVMFHSKQCICLLSSKLFPHNEVLVLTLNCTYVYIMALHRYRYRCGHWPVCVSHMRQQLSHFHI